MGTVCFDAVARLKEMGQIRDGDEVVVFVTGAAQKYLEALPVELPAIDKDRPVDYEYLLGVSQRG
jgi:threonine synthase